MLTFMFFFCSFFPKDARWSCACTATLKIVAHQEGKADHMREIQHIFHANEMDWGWARFMTFEVSKGKNPSAKTNFVAFHPIFIRFYWITTMAGTMRKRTRSRLRSTSRLRHQL